MKLFHSVGILGSLVLAGLAGCSGAAGDASTNNQSPVASKVLVTGNNPNQVGDVLTVSYTYTDPENDTEPAAGSQFRWLRGGAAITGATGRTYTLMLGDAGKTITAEVTPLAQTGARSGAPVVSNFVTVAPADPVALMVSAGLKQLRFNWAPVSGAATYQVSYNADGVSGFTVVSGNLGTTSYDWDIGVHRINWPQAQFLLEACDAGGCLPSASISAVSLMVGAIGYFKASNTGAGDSFGMSVALSADGTTLAVGARSEDSPATGIGGSPVDDCMAATPVNCARDSGAVYVYIRSDTTWSQQGYVKASNTGAGDFFGASVALSADGSTLAVGAFGEASSGTSSTPDELAPNSGAVYIYTRTAATWSQQGYVKASNAGGAGVFGVSIALSADGNTLAVGAYGEDSAATGIGGNQINGCAATPVTNCASGSGAVYVYIRSGIVWSQQAYIKATNTGAVDAFGHSVALSADGNTLAVGASQEKSAATGIDGNQTNGCATTPVTNCASFSGAVYVYTRRSTTWSPQAYVKASNTDASDSFGFSVSLSGDGNTLAVGAYNEDSAATGIGGNQINGCSAIPVTNCVSRSGAVYVYTRNDTTWTQQAYLKASNTARGSWFDWFGYSISLSTDGNALAVGAYNENSAATGIGGNQTNGCATNPVTNCASSSGAVYVYIRSATTWAQQAYVKASNTEASDYFGYSVALNGNGNTLAVGAMSEGSAGTGVNNTLLGQSNNSAPSAGAVYLY